MSAPPVIAPAPAVPAGPAVTVPGRPQSTRCGASRRPAVAAATRLRAVDRTPPESTSSAGSTVDVPAADAAGATGSITVTIRVAPDAPARHHRVLTALHELVQLAGPDAAVAGPHVDTLAPGAVGIPGAASQPAVVLDPLPRTVLVRGVPLELSRLEYDLLLFLARHPRRVFSRTQLLAQVWGHTRTGARTIDVHVSRLRTKLGPATDVITTVYGLGYRLGDEVAVTVLRG